MSNRTDAMKSALPNPAKYRFDWRSKHEKFGFYDPSKEGDAKQGLKKLPFQFLVLDLFHSVGGFNTKLEKGIWSNEVADIKNDILTVRFQGGGEIAKGVYSDIKDHCNLNKGVYHKVAYIMLKNGELARLELKGTAAFSFSDTLNKMGDKKYTHFIECLSFEEESKGDVDYTVPVFTEGAAIGDKLNEAADNQFDVLDAYIKSRSKDHEDVAPTTEPEPASKPPEGSITEDELEALADIDTEDLPF